MSRRLFDTDILSEVRVSCLPPIDRVDPSQILDRSSGMTEGNFAAIVQLGAIAFVVSACSGGAGGTSTGGQATGGIALVGGASTGGTATGGAVANGGSEATGGGATGGKATGAPSGGLASTDGGATGGQATGGGATGGAKASTGGAATGGVAAAGAGQTGGAAPAATGGTGASATGGTKATTGGTQAAAGGAATGGTKAATGGSQAATGGSTGAASSYWKPAPNTTFYWDLTNAPPDNTKNVGAYDIDGWNNTTAEVTTLHALGIKVVCYMDAGTYEPGRPDSSAFPANLQGNAVSGWPGEYWLDVRPSGPNYVTLQSIMLARFQVCKQKGFDAVEPDNMDSYQNDPGFPTTAQDQLSYNEWIAQTVHSLGMAVFQKNDLDQIPTLVTYFDGILDEECNKYSECSTLAPYTQAKKPVWNAEYSEDGEATSAFCPADVSAGIIGALFRSIWTAAYLSLAPTTWARPTDGVHQPTKLVEAGKIRSKPQVKETFLSSIRANASSPQTRVMQISRCRVPTATIDRHRRPFRLHGRECQLEPAIGAFRAR